MKLPLFQVLGVALCALYVSGCATIMQGKKQDIVVESSPSGATVKTSEGQRITTPGTLVLVRKRDVVVTVEKEGYESSSQVMKKEWSWWLVGNILLGGIIGIAVDFTTGAAYDLNPEHLNVQLVPRSGLTPTVVKGEGLRGGSTVIADVDLVKTTDRRRPHAHGVVIGIEQYRQQLPKADFATQDAEVMGRYLTKYFGYPEENVVVLVNERAAKSDIEKYIEQWLPNRVEKDDAVFIYFSGHGAPNTKTGDAYLVPYDGDPAFVETTGYPLKRLYEQLAKLPAKEIVVVLDSCFSGAGGRSVIAKGMRPMILSVENPILASGNTAVLTASSGSQVSSTYDGKGHGLMTYFFLKGLQGDGDVDKDGMINLLEIFEYMKPQVERVARREFNNEQTPQLLGNPELLKKGIRLLY